MATPEKFPLKLNPRFTEKFLHDIPKVDLHVHLDGSLRSSFQLCLLIFRVSTIIELAKLHNVALPFYTEVSLVWSRFLID